MAVFVFHHDVVSYYNLYIINECSHKCSLCIGNMLRNNRNVSAAKAWQTNKEALEKNTEMVKWYLQKRV